jgi:predicted metal-dependent peptidase
LKPGVMPKKAPRQLKPVNRSAVPWGILLRRLAAQNLSPGGMHQLDYTFQRPHRRSAILHPLYLPALREMPNFASRIACVIDTSGSIEGYQLSQALHEVWRLAYEFRAQVTVIPCDSEPK